MALIETPVIGWLEMEFAPPTYTPEQLDELDQLTEAMIVGNRFAEDRHL